MSRIAYAFNSAEYPNAVALDLDTLEHDYTNDPSSGKILTDSVTLNGYTYTQTYTYDSGGNLISVSQWIVQPTEEIFLVADDGTTRLVADNGDFLIGS